MSADEVLASNLWAWPDPLLKRDRIGQVLFVNAAFLQLYGGRVEDWYGKPLTGWPAPVQAGAQRFETRAGDGANESVFDWVESVMADGNALAIARNVTVFMPPPTPPAEEITPPAPEPQSQKMVQKPAQEAMPAPAPAAPEPAVEAPVASEATSRPVSAPAPEQIAPDLSAEFEETLNKRADEYAYEENKAEAEARTPQAAIATPPVADQLAAEQTAPVLQEQSAPAPQPEPASQPESREDTRMMERRALPIKDSTSVLGSNWRDQVIAKAVGGPEPEEDVSAPTNSAEVEETEDEAPKPGTGLNILLAEDNAINALLTRTLLEADGAEVDTVEDGALALEAVSKKKYDLIFMDMRMPNMDGLESTRKIRAFGFTKPIIALTANAFDDDRNACFDSGMNDFMTKPVSAEELSEMVVNWTKDDEEKKLAS